MSTPTRPVLRYHGGKARLRSWIISHFPPHRTYVEPFGGAASVLMGKPRSYDEVYGELDDEICNVFRVLRNPVLRERLTEACALTPFARAEFVLSYEPHPDPVEQARRTVFRSMAGFGSPAASGRKTGFRANSNRSNTTPAHDWTNYPQNIAAWGERLAGVVIENRPAADVIRQHDSPETLIYADPPYPHSTRTGTAKYDTIYRHEMKDEAHHALAEVLHSCDGFVVISGYPCGLYDNELYADWHRVTRDALADGAAKRTEVLWLNPRTVAALNAITPTLELGA